MENFVTVKADELGNVIVRSENNPEWGYIRVEQSRIIVDDNGFAKPKNLSALIPGTIEDLKSFGWSEGQKVKGKVITKNSMSPFNKKDPERDLKYAGISGIICTLEGEPIFSKNFFTFDTEAQDKKIQHDNSDEIREAYARMKSNASIAQNTEDFEL
jgi:hypothetical protein